MSWRACLQTHEHEHAHQVRECFHGKMHGQAASTAYKHQLQASQCMEAHSFEQSAVCLCQHGYKLLQLLHSRANQKGILVQSGATIASGRCSSLDWLRPHGSPMCVLPMRTPPGFMALLSPTTAFLLSVMWASSHAFSILAPEMPSPADIGTATSGSNRRGDGDEHQQ